MTIHPLPQASDTLTADPTSTAYDSIWTGQAVPEQQPEGLERVMLQQDKLYVVLAVVLIIWLGLTFFILRTDRRLDRLERTAEARIAEGSEML